MKEQIQANFRAYGEAQKLCAQFWQKPVKVETLLEKASTGIRAQVQPLVLGAIRHKRLIDWVLGELLRRAPKREARSLLIVALGEYLSDNPAHAVVDHAVKLAKARLSAAEARMVNAVLRKGVTLLEETRNRENPQQWGVCYSHPDDLVAGWLDAFGEVSTRALLEWNQSPSPVYINIEQGVDIASIKEFLESSKWLHFYRLKPGAWQHVQPLLQSGQAYIQDPSTRIPIELGAPKPGEKVLDLCAAPGGKSRQIAHALAGDSQSLLVALDLPGKRIERLKENLAKVQNIAISVVDHDLRTLTSDIFEDQHLPAAYDAVFLDAPCSNTGVLRRRPDAKERLSSSAIAEVAKLQEELLIAASAWVRPGGRLVYSTCSIEAAENKDQIEGFLKDNPAFKLEKSHLSYPWHDGHDGGGAFLLERLGS